MKRIRHGRQSGGFSLLEAIIVAGTLIVLLAILLLALAKAQKKTKRINCTNNLKQIGLSFRLWAGDNNGKYPMQVSTTDGGTLEMVGSGAAYPHFRVMSNELNTPKILVCPDDTKTREKAWAALALARKTKGGYNDPFPMSFPVSYFVGVDAQPGSPTMFLSGDANLAVGGKPAKPGLLSLWTNSPVAWAKPLRPYHGEGGYIGLGDGSVQLFSSARLQQALAETGEATNRLAMP